VADGAHPEASAIGAWRASTLGALIAWELSSAVLSAALLSWVTRTEPAYQPLLAVGWVLVVLLAALAAARRLPWRVRTLLFLLLNFAVVILACSSLRPTAVAFANALSLVALGGLLLGGRAALGAAALVTVTLALTALAGGAGLGTPRPALPAGQEWLAALAGGLPPIVMLVVALRRIVDRLGQALDTAVATVRELELTRSQLAESERAELAGRLAGALAHDLNNTLTVVVANAEWLTERLNGPEETEAALQIWEAARNSAALTQQVLLASRTGMSQPRPIDVSRVTSAAAGALRRLLQPGIEVETRLAGPVWAHFDPGHLQQILLSLALNARTAMPGGGTLLLSVRAGGAARPDRPELPPPAAILEVSETGFGMDPEERRRAFEPLSGREPRRGAGLALSGVKALTEAGGGEVLLRSRPGTGTIVTLTLPGALPPASERAATTPPRRARVLVAEDDIRVRALVCTALAEAGHEVHEVADGTQAMRAIEELGNVDLLLTDVIMPGAPLGEVIATFRARHPGGRILVCSAFSEDEGLRRRVHSGEYRLLPKPFTRGDLLGEVQALLAEPAAATRPTGEHKRVGAG